MEQSQKTSIDENILVDGKKINTDEFQEMINNPKIRLKEIGKNKYKKLNKLEG